MRFGETVIVFECQCYCALRQSVALFGRDKAVITSQCVTISQPAICQRIAWIFNNRFLKKISCSFKAVIGALVPMIASLQICLVGFTTLGVGLCQLRLIRSAQF